MQTRLPHRLSARSARFLSRFLLAVFCLGYVGETLHSWLEPHVACFEHGEAIHQDAEPQSPLALPASLARGNSFKNLPLDRQSVGHDHCALVAIGRKRRDSLTPAISNQCTEPPPRTSAVFLASLSPVIPKTPVYRLAPKLSPPA